MTRISGGSDSYVARASRKMRSSEQLIVKWSPALLRMELDKWLWREQNDIGIKKLWEVLCTYNYMPRLRDADVLLDAIKAGLENRDYFAYATSTREGRYEGLEFAKAGATVYLDAAAALVRPEAAARQLEADAAAGAAQASTGYRDLKRETVTGAAVKNGASSQASTTSVAPVKRPIRFHGSVELDPNRVGRDAGRIAEEVVQHLAGLKGARVRVTLEIDAEVQEGVPDNVVRTVTENARTLKFAIQGFEES